MRGRPSRRTRWRQTVLRFRGQGMTGEIRALMLVLADHMDAHAVVSVPRSTLADLFDVTPSRITARIGAAVELQLLAEVVAGGPGVQAVYQGLIPGSPPPRAPRGAVLRSATTDQADGPPPRTKLRSATTDHNMVRPTEPSTAWSATTDQAMWPEDPLADPGLSTARAPARHNGYPGKDPDRTPTDPAVAVRTSTQSSTPGTPIRRTNNEPPEARTGPDYEPEKRRQLAALEQLIAGSGTSDGDQPQGEA